MANARFWLAALAAASMSNGAVAADASGALYGDIRWSLDYAEDNSALPGPSYNATDNNSFWGVKASVTEGSLTAFGAYERFLDNDAQFGVDLVRQSYAGLAAGWGTVTVGTFETAYARAGRKADPFYDTAASGIAGVTAFAVLVPGSSHGSSAALNGNFVGGAISANQIAYASPAFAGITVNAALFIDDSTTGADQDHDFGGGVEFNNAGISAGLQVLDVNSDGTNVLGMFPHEEAYRLHGGYSGERFGVHASFEKLDLVGASDADYRIVSGWFGVTPATRLAASVGQENESGAEGTSFRFGVFQNVIENLTIWAVARQYDEGRSANPDASVFSLGASYKFRIGAAAR